MAMTASNIARELGEVRLPVQDPRKPIRVVSDSISLQLERIVPVSSMAMLSLTMVMLQVLDGWLTLVGVQLFGIGVEGNPLIRNLMYAIGTAQALLIVKLLALAVIGCLAYLSSYVKWIPTAMRALVLVYVCAAILPWGAILITELSA